MAVFSQTITYRYLFIYFFEICLLHHYMYVLEV